MNLATGRSERPYKGVYRSLFVVRLQRGRGCGFWVFLRLDLQVGLHHPLHRRGAPPAPPQGGVAVQVHVAFDVLPGPAQGVDDLGDG